MSICPDSFFDCNNNNLTPEDVLRKLIQPDVNGCPAINTKVVSASTNDCTTFISCVDKDLSWKDLVMLLIGTDDNGCPAVRVIDSSL